MYPVQFEKSQLDAAIALNRFGYGAKMGEVNAVANIGAKAWLRAQIRINTSNPAYNMFLNGGDSGLNHYEFQRSEPNLPLAKFKDIKTQQRMARLVYPHLAQGLAHSVQSPNPFHERIVRFWMNHFIMTSDDSFTHPLILAFEQDVVRRFMNSRYYDMLLAALRHPAMLLIYQNALSAGRNSIHANSDDRFLNPQLARLAVERLTIGRDHKDASAVGSVLADMMTGWSVAKDDMTNQLVFSFNEDLHQPGRKNLLGKTYQDAGALQAEAALWTLSSMPNSAQNIAFRIAQHFLSDTPDSQDVDRIALAYMNNQGGLIDVFDQLIASKSAFDPAPTKLKTPEDLVFSFYRNFDSSLFEHVKALNQDQGVPLATAQQQAQTRFGMHLISALTGLGQPPLYGNPAKGWSDRGSDWLLPDLLRQRLNWFLARASEYQSLGSGGNLAQSLLERYQSLLSINDYARISATFEGSGALELFLTSPLFQRR